ncbi:MAG: hypothetical protein KFB94_07825 [Methylophilaceae bacterium]|nr:MAG: hypothetical protein KFB94_07825 [Methylophilaceae bacterium]
MRQLNKTKLEKLIAKLDAGKAVSLRDLENVLGLDGLVEYERLWNEELARRKFFEVKPTALADYEAMLKRADLLTIRAEKTVTVNSAKNLRVLASAEYDAALAHLQAYITKNEADKFWLDRDAFGVFGVLGLINQVPRLVTSRSVHKLTEGASAKTSKEDIKRIVLQTALDKIVAEQKTFSESADGIKLKAMLAKLMKDGR